MQGLIPLTKVGKGHVERVGKYQYLSCIKDNHGNAYEITAIDPHAARQSAMDFCAHNGISLQIFTVSEEVQRAHVNDIDDFLKEHEGEQVQAGYVPGIKRAI